MTATRTGAGMALVSMFCVQLGIAASVGLFDEVGSDGAACLRLAFAGLIMLAIVRPQPGAFSRSSLAAAIALGAVTAAMTMCFLAAVDRIPMGTASALEFLGPLGVAILRGRGSTKAWPAVAAIGVLLLTEPWRGALDPAGVAFALAAAVAWALYIVLTQRVGDEVAGLQGLAISMPVAGLVATVVAGPSLVGDLTLEVLLAGFGLAILLPVIPFALEMLALRRLTATAFGTLMSLEPALALLIGLIVLGQAPGLLPVAGIAFVVVAGIGAERTGARPGPEARDRVAAVPLRQDASSRSSTPAARWPASLDVGRPSSTTAGRSGAPAAHQRPCDLPEFERYHHRFAVTEEVLREQDFGREPGFVALVDGAPEPAGCCAGCLCCASSRSR